MVFQANFLSAYLNQDKSRATTHTSLAGGSYHVPCGPISYPDPFLSDYLNAFRAGKPLYLTERVPKSEPFRWFGDLDYPFTDSVRDWTPKQQSLAQNSRWSWAFLIHPLRFIPNTRKPQKFTIKIRFTNLLSMEDLHKFINNQGPPEVPRASMTLLQLILAHRPKMIFTAFHKSTHWGFYDAYKTNFINGGLTLAGGWQQSVKYTLGSMLLTIYVSNTECCMI
ncbi:hypothetical protein HDU81_010736 [Chytriomyces hyalinus]|nr:hypothetical protein HDU81_010736 [Chytriomyces hyalinus]